MKYLIDSDYVADFLKGRPYAVQILSDFFLDGLAISIITFAEVYEGIYYGQKQLYYAEAFKKFLQGVRVLNINTTIAKEYAIIRGGLARKGQLIDQPDIFIAATALHHNLSLITRNLKDYERISQLKLYKENE